MALLLVVLCLLAGCDHTRTEIEAAKQSRYDAEFAEVYSAALDATRTWYPNLDDQPGRGRISTAWHEMTMVEGSEELANQHTMANASGVTAANSQSASSGQSSSGASLGGSAPVALKSKRYYIRFDVTVLDGRPWRVRIDGHASSWDTGAAMPTELRGIEKPPWLEGRTNKLRLAIHKRLKRYAVIAKKEEHVKDDRMPKLDPAAFHDVPASAGLLLARVRLAILKRDFDALRVLLADDVIWSSGAHGDALQALAVWQADPSVLDAMKADGDGRTLARAEGLGDSPSLVEALTP